MQHKRMRKNRLKNSMHSTPRNDQLKTKKKSKYKLISNLVFYAQSTSTVISVQKKKKKRKKKK